MTDGLSITLSLIIPLYNRPEEIGELLHSLTLQSDSDFEVVVVEDGSSVDARDIIEKFAQSLNIQYLVKENGGPGPARNFGAEHATGQYLIFLDSDCIIPGHYVETVREALQRDFVDAFGGPDRAHPSFSNIQKSINYAMTSPITTGGIRGGRNSLEKFHPRSFNMGISASVFKSLKGFAAMRFGEDVDFSMRIMEAGKTTRLIPEAFVYHKRRTDFRKFFRQVHNSGIARIHLSLRHPGSLRPVHMLPSVFVIGSFFTLLLSVLWTPYLLVPLVALFTVIFINAAIQEKNLTVGALSVIAVVVQLVGYGTGFIAGWWRRIVLKQPEFQAYEETFYK